jgi:hypothetical protein
MAKPGKKKRATTMTTDRNGRPVAVSSLHVATKPRASSRSPRITDGKKYPVVVRRITDAV